VPLVAFLPLHPPEAVHTIALVEDQVTVEILPDVMLVGLAEIVTVGPPLPPTGPGVGVVGGVDPPDGGVDPPPDGGVDPPPATVADAEQLALVPPLEPPQLHVHGPEPATDDAVPAEQRLVEGLDDAVMPFADPHTPLTGAGAAFTATVVLAAGDTPPLPIQVSV
jgi:hypothetical protein